MDANNRKLEIEVKHRSSPHSDGIKNVTCGTKYAVSNCNSSIIIWDIADINNIKIKQIFGDSHVNLIKLNRSETLLVIVAWDGCVKLYDIEVGSAIVLGYMNDISCVDISRDDKYVAVGCDDGVCVFYTENTRSVFFEWIFRATSVSFSSNNLLACAYDFHLRVWDVESRTVRLDRYISASIVAFSHDDSYLICCDQVSIKTVSLESGETLCTVYNNNRPSVVSRSGQAATAIHPTSAYVATCTYCNDLVYLWDLCTHTVTPLFKPKVVDPPITCISFNTDGSLIVYGDCRGNISFASVDITHYSNV